VRVGTHLFRVAAHTYREPVARSREDARPVHRVADGAVGPVGCRSE